MTIKITWSDGRTTTETGHNRCINREEYSAEELFRIICSMAHWSDIKPVSYEEVEG